MALSRPVTSRVPAPVASLDVNPDSTTQVRTAREDDLELLPAIQLAAGAAFRDIGMAAIADSAPLAAEALAAYQRAGHAWVAVTADDVPSGFIVVDLIDGRAHIEQVSVHPDHARRGIGGLLINHVDRWAAGQGIDALTLATFRAVPWNGPYYARLGFRDMAPAEITAGLAALLDDEAAHGIDPAARVCMYRATTAH
jgi:GNAT superfamily N-acetyltransferase